MTSISKPGPTLGTSLINRSVHDSRPWRAEPSVGVGTDAGSATWAPGRRFTGLLPEVRHDRFPHPPNDHASTTEPAAVGARRLLAPGGCWLVAEPGPMTAASCPQQFV